MIYVDFTGRCGNQMFQYAFARKIMLAVNNKETIQFNFYNVDRWKEKTGDVSFSNQLKFFNCVKSIFSF